MPDAYRAGLSPAEEACEQLISERHVRLAFHQLHSAVDALHGAVREVEWIVQDHFYAPEA